MYILATDYDGTLNRGGISAADREAIARFREAGNLFGVVTGRHSDMYDTLVNEKLEFDFVIVMNGAMTLDTDGKIVFEVAGSASVVRGVTELMGSRYDNFLNCVSHRNARRFYSQYPDGNEKYLPMSEIDELSTFTQMNTWVKTDELAKQAVAELNEKFGEHINALQNGSCIDIPPRGIDKGVGVARYADAMGVPHENVWCAGDNMNDMAMIVRFHGCAVSNARAEVKAAAKGTYDGIYAIIEDIMK